MVGIFCQNAIQVLNAILACPCFRGEPETVELVGGGSDQQQALELFTLTLTSLVPVTGLAKSWQPVTVF